ncbi:MAG: autotransporter outer membrane beta-barrel domain-containing protein [Rickettsia endosymbiont of Pentastiridius leporinus]
MQSFNSKKYFLTVFISISLLACSFLSTNAKASLFEEFKTKAAQWQREGKTFDVTNAAKEFNLYKYNKKEKKEYFNLDHLEDKDKKNRRIARTQNAKLEIFKALLEESSLEKKVENRIKQNDFIDLRGKELVNSALSKAAEDLSIDYNSQRLKDKNKSVIHEEKNKEAILNEYIKIVNYASLNRQISEWIETGKADITQKDFKQFPFLKNIEIKQKISFIKSQIEQNTGVNTSDKKPTLLEQIAKGLHLKKTSEKKDNKKKTVLIFNEEMLNDHEQDKYKQNNSDNDDDWEDEVDSSNGNQHTTNETRETKETLTPKQEAEKKWNEWKQNWNTQNNFETVKPQPTSSTSEKTQQEILEETRKTAIMEEELKNIVKKRRRAFGNNNSNYSDDDSSDEWDASRDVEKEDKKTPGKLTDRKEYQHASNVISAHLEKKQGIKEEKPEPKKLDMSKFSDIGNLYSKGAEQRQEIKDKVESTFSSGAPTSEREDNDNSGDGSANGNPPPPPPPLSTREQLKQVGRSGFVPPPPPPLMTSEQLNQAGEKAEEAQSQQKKNNTTNYIQNPKPATPMFQDELVRKLAERFKKQTEGQQEPESGQQQQQEQDSQRQEDEQRRQQQEQDSQRQEDAEARELEVEAREMAAREVEAESQRQEEEKNDDESYENETKAEVDNQAIDIISQSESHVEEESPKVHIQNNAGTVAALLEKLSSNHRKPIHMVITQRFNAGIAAGDEDVTVTRGVWVSGLYGTSSQGAWKNIPKYKGRTAGVTIGVDTEFSDSSDIIGIAYSRIESHFKYNKKLGKTALNGHLISAYGLKELPKNFSLQGIASFGHNYIKNKTKNANNIVGKYKNNNFNFESLLSYKYRTKYDIYLIPNIGLKYDYSRSGDYKESGNIQNLMIEKKSNQLLESSFGSKIVFSPLRVSNDIAITPSVHGNIENHFYNKNSKVKARATFKDQVIEEVINLPKQPRVGYNIGGNIVLSRKNINVLLEHNYYTHKKYQSHKILVKLKVNL